MGHRSPARSGGSDSTIGADDALAGRGVGPGSGRRARPAGESRWAAVGGPARRGHGRTTSSTVGDRIGRGVWTGTAAVGLRGGRRGDRRVLLRSGRRLSRRVWRGRERAAGPAPDRPAELPACRREGRVRRAAGRAAGRPAGGAVGSERRRIGEVERELGERLRGRSAAGTGRRAGRADSARNAELSLPLTCRSSPAAPLCAPLRPRSPAEPVQGGYPQVRNKRTEAGTEYSRNLRLFSGNRRLSARPRPTLARSPPNARESPTPYGVMACPQRGPYGGTPSRMNQRPSRSRPSSSNTSTAMKLNQSAWSPQPGSCGTASSQRSLAPRLAQVEHRPVVAHLGDRARHDLGLVAARHAPHPDAHRAPLGREPERAPDALEEAEPHRPLRAEPARPARGVASSAKASTERRLSRST